MGRRRVRGVVSAMRLPRAAAVVVLVVLLATTVAAGNTAVAAERTVLSGGFVKATLAETDAYGTARTVVIEQATAPAGTEAESVGEPSDGPPDVFGNATGRIVEEAVTEAYLRREVERNVDRTYGYLHGDREALVLAVDLAPVQDEITDVLEAEIRNATLAELFGSLGPEASTVPVGGATVNLTVVGEMGESEAAYEAARAEFRADVRASVLDRLVNRTFEAASDDERLALVIEDYDPDSYSAGEKAAMVETREAEIRAAMRGGIEAERGDEVDAAVAATLDRLAAVDRDGLATELNGSADGLPPGVAPPLADIVATGTAGLATDMPYETFVARTDDAKARLAANVTALIEDEIAAEGTDRLVLADTREPTTAQGFEVARQAVGVVDILSVLLPLLSLLLVGALWLATRSAAVVAGAVGVGLVVGGLPGYVLAARAPDVVRRSLGRAELPPEAAGLALAVLDRVLGVFAVQSLALVVAGAGLLVVAGHLHVYGTPMWARRG